MHMTQEEGSGGSSSQKGRSESRILRLIPQVQTHTLAARETPPQRCSASSTPMTGSGG